MLYERFFEVILRLIFFNICIVQLLSNVQGMDNLSISGHLDNLGRLDSLGHMNDDCKLNNRIIMVLYFQIWKV